MSLFDEAVEDEKNALIVLLIVFLISGVVIINFVVRGSRDIHCSKGCKSSSSSSS